MLEGEMHRIHIKQGRNPDHLSEAYHILCCEPIVLDL